MASKSTDPLKQLLTLTKSIQKDINGLKQNFGRLEQEVGGLKQEVGGFKQDFRGIKQEVGGFKQDFRGIKQEVGGFKQDFRGIKQEIGGLKQDFNNLKFFIEQRFQKQDTEFEQRLFKFRSKIFNHIDIFAKTYKTIDQEQTIHTYKIEDHENRITILEA